VQDNDPQTHHANPFSTPLFPWASVDFPSLSKVENHNLYSLVSFSQSRDTEEMVEERKHTN
jgi:hypothetical protein